MTHTRHALVIGGGVAGPVAAMALQKASIEATVSEAHPRTAEGIGIFLTVASNGIDALRSIDADGSVLAAGFPTPGILLCSGTGKQLGAARAGLPLADGTTSHTLKRAGLHTAIHQQATARGIPVQHGKRLVDVEQAGDGVRAVFDDGSEATGDVLIGADGIHSAVRRHIDPNAPAPTYVGLINLGGYAHGVPVDAEPASYTMIFGKRAFFGYALAPDGEVWWFANVPRADEPARDQSRRPRPRNGNTSLPSCTPRTPGPRSGWCRPATPTTSCPPPLPTPCRTCRPGAAAAWPVVRVIRDALLPFMKMTANSKQVTEQFGYHINWNTPLGPADGRLLHASGERT